MLIYTMRIYTMRIYTIHSPTALPAILQHDRRSMGKYNTPPANPEIQPCQPPDLPIRAHLSSSSEPDNRPSPSMYPPFPHLRNPQIIRNKKSGLAGVSREPWTDGLRWL